MYTVYSRCHLRVGALFAPYGTVNATSEIGTRFALYSTRILDGCWSGFQQFPSFQFVKYLGGCGKPKIGVNQKRGSLRLALRRLL